MAIIRLHQNRVNPLVLPVILAQELGYFADQQVEVDLRLAETFRFSSQDEFLQGDVDGIMGDTSFFFYYLEKKKQALITANLTRTIQIVGAQGVTPATEELVIGVNRTGLFRFFQQRFLTGPLAQAEVKWLNNTFERIDALRQGEINGLVAIEPFIAQVLAEFAGEVLWHSRQIPHYFVMWCFDQPFVQEHPRTIRGFHQAIEAAAQDFNALSGDEKERQCLQVAGYTAEAARGMRDFMFEAQANYQGADFDMLQAWMFAEGEISQLHQSTDCIFNTFDA